MIDFHNRECNEGDLRLVTTMMTSSRARRRLCSVVDMPFHLLTVQGLFMFEHELPSLEFLTRRTQGFSGQLFLTLRPALMSFHRTANPPPMFVRIKLYNAHTVGCDALWAGVPMVTLCGEKMASRVGASLVSAAGLRELVTDNVKEYTKLIQELAR